MKLKSLLLGAVLAMTMAGQAFAGGCPPKSKPNPCNSGHGRPEVSDCGGGHHDDDDDDDDDHDGGKPKCGKCHGRHSFRSDDCDGRGKIKFVVVIIKMIFGCRA